MGKVDVTVIGGGLIGCATAYHLARSGAAVVVLERGQVNQGASGQNAGSLHFQLEHRMLQDGAARSGDLEQQAGLARLSIRLWRGLAEELDTELELQMSGGLMVAETPEEVAALERKQAIEAGQGLEVELLDREGARRIAPYLDDRIRAALYCPREGHCNPRLLTPAYVRKLVEQGGRLITGAEVRALRRRRGRWAVAYREAAQSEVLREVASDMVLDAAGVDAARIAAMAGLNLPVFPVGLTISATEKTGARVPHLIQHVGRRLSLKQTGDGNLLVGGGWPSRVRQRDGHWATDQAPEIRIASVTGNLQVACAVVPLVRSLRLLRTWTGATAMTPDQLPVLGEIPQAPGFHVAAGGSGFTHGPAFAVLLGETMLGREPSHPIAPFSPTRFAALNEFVAQPG